MLRRLWPLVALCLVLSISTAQAQLAPTAEPAAVGLSAERLSRASGRMQSYVEEGRVAGLMTMIYRRGEVAHFRTYGERDRQTGAPMTPNTLFFVDPTEELIAMVWTQVFPFGRYPIGDQFRVGVYQSIVD